MFFAPSLKHIITACTETLNSPESHTHVRTREASCSKRFTDSHWKFWSWWNDSLNQEALIRCSTHAAVQKGAWAQTTYSSEISIILQVWLGSECVSVILNLKNYIHVKSCVFWDDLWVNFFLSVQAAEIIKECWLRSSSSHCFLQWFQLPDSELPPAAWVCRDAGLQNSGINTAARIYQSSFIKCV